MHEAAHLSTPLTISRNRFDVSAEIRCLIQNKRRLKRLWKLTRNPVDKRNLNRATTELKERLKEIKNLNFKTFLKNHTTHNNRNDEINLWKATKYIKKSTKRNVPIKDLMIHGVNQIVVKRALFPNT